MTILPQPFVLLSYLIYLAQIAEKGLETGPICL